MFLGALGVHCGILLKVFLCVWAINNELLLIILKQWGRSYTSTNLENILKIGLVFFWKSSSKGLRDSSKWILIHEIIGRKQVQANKSQNKRPNSEEGGWRYNPAGFLAELEVESNLHFFQIPSPIRLPIWPRTSRIQNRILVNSSRANFFQMIANFQFFGAIFWKIITHSLNVQN